MVVQDIAAGDDPGALWSQVHAVADPLDPLAHARPAALVVLGLSVAIAYLVSERRQPGPAEFVTKVLGGLMAVVNGYLMVGEVTRLLGPAEVGVSVSARGLAAHTSDGDSAALIVVVITVLVIAFGLYSAQRTGAGPPPRQ